MTQKKIQPLQIAYTCNDKMFNPLFLSILSIVKRTKRKINFYLFSANLKNIRLKYKILSKKHQRLIQNMIKKYSPDSTFEVFDCREYYLKRLGKQKISTDHWPPYAAFRLLFDMFKQLQGTVLYLDPDTMACGDISQFFKVNLKNYEMCVTRDIYDWDKELKGKYFNSGVLLMNMDMIRKTQLLKKTFKYMLKVKPKFCDQDSLNKSVTYVKYCSDDRFNRIWKSRKSNTIIKHFAGPCPKPWKRNFFRKSQHYNYLVWKSDIAEWRAIVKKI